MNEVIFQLFCAVYWLPEYWIWKQVIQLWVIYGLHSRACVYCACVCFLRILAVWLSIAFIHIISSSFNCLYDSVSAYIHVYVCVYCALQRFEFCLLVLILIFFALLQCFIVFYLIYSFVFCISICISVEIDLEWEVQQTNCNLKLIYIEKDICSRPFASIHIYIY